MGEACSDTSKRRKIELVVLEILKNSDIETTTEFSVRTAAAERLGFALSDLADKLLVREVVDSFLLSTAAAITNSSPADHYDNLNKLKNDIGLQEKVQKELQGAGEQQLNGGGVELHEKNNERVVSKGPQEQQMDSSRLELHEKNNGRVICKLSDKKRVAIHDFKGTKVVSFRDFYEKDGKLFPKRGIGLTSKQWSMFRNSFPSIEEAIRKMELRIRSEDAAKQTALDMTSSVVDHAHKGQAIENNQIDAGISVHPLIQRKETEGDTSTTTAPGFASQGHLRYDAFNSFIRQRLIPIQTSRLDGKNYHSWRHNMEFFLKQLNVAYVLTEPCPIIPLNSETSLEENVGAKAAVQRWTDDDYICQHNILNSLSDHLFHHYSQKNYSAKELWEQLQLAYNDDFGTIRSQINKYIHFQMVDGVSVLEQVQELQNIANSIMASGTWIDEYFHVSTIVSKLPPSWKEYRVRLMQEEFLPLNMLMHWLKNEEESRVSHKDKPTSNKAPFAEPKFDNRFLPRRENKRVCYNCGKEGHIVKWCPNRKLEAYEKSKEKEQEVHPVHGDVNMTEGNHLV